MTGTGGEALSRATVTRQTGALAQHLEGLVSALGPAGDSGWGSGGDDVLAPPDAGWAPGTFGPPEAPLTVSMGARTADALTVTWRNRVGATSNFLLRQRAGGPWEEVAEFGALSGWTTYTDGGLEPDTTYCYRVRSATTFGSNSTPLDNRACGHTRGLPTIVAWRVQLRIRTADLSDAGSNNQLQARLNYSRFSDKPNANATWMDYGPRLAEEPRWPYGQAWSDDFARGRDFTYDLKLDYVRELADITMLTLHKDGIRRDCHCRVGATREWHHRLQQNLR